MTASAEPCRSCARRETDFGGCRCQALSLTGDAARTDPVCELSPDHHLVTDAVAAASSAASPAVSSVGAPPAPLIPRA